MKYNTRNKYNYSRIYRLFLVYKISERLVSQLTGRLSLLFNEKWLTITINTKYKCKYKP